MRPVLPALALVCAALTILTAATQSPAVPVPEHSAADAWLKLLKLRTTASIMHTTAHPDDEHGGVLALLGRGEGARVSLLTLTRGESGDNAIGPELFDALGLIRTEELLLANRFYGVDEQYFTRAVDYGFSKRLDEALQKWGPEAVLRDMVGIIRTERPLVIVSRFQGTARDGHGQHQAAGLLTQQAVEAAGNPQMFPEQIEAGLRPWQPLKLYVGGVREAENWTVRVDAGQYNPVIGESYALLGRRGLSVQRSQTSGRLDPDPGPSSIYYVRVFSRVESSDREGSFLDGIDTTLPGLYGLFGADSPPGAAERLTAIAREIEGASAAFSFTAPSRAVPALASALEAARAARTADGGHPDVAHVLDRKIGQLADAIHAALGIRFSAVAQPKGGPAPGGPFAPGPLPLGPVTPGRSFEVRTTFVHRGDEPLESVRVTLADNDAAADWDTGAGAAAANAAPHEPLVASHAVEVPADAAVARPFFTRESLQDALYAIAPGAERYRPSARAPLDARVEYRVHGVAVELRQPVTVVESNAPYGQERRELSVLPAIAVSLDRPHLVVPLGAAPVRLRVTAEVANNSAEQAAGTLRLEAPAEWTVIPDRHIFSLDEAGARARFDFELSARTAGDGEYRVAAVASSGGREYREGYTALRHRDLETRYSFREAAALVRPVDVRIAPGLGVGYVMGIGDEVPSALAQLGVDVQMLGAGDLATGDLRKYRAIITGTRAYGVRDDLRTSTRRLLDYVHAGGHLIVLYNTPELVPDLHAPYPGELPRTAEEVSEEDSPVEILAPDHQVFRTPNLITPDDFTGWVEQRGSKFWSAWDARYTPMLASWDTGQAPQRGGWLHARYGKGHYTYFAYALHRQLPYGVPGAYRIVANLLSLE